MGRPWPKLLPDDPVGCPERAAPSGELNAKSPPAVRRVIESPMAGPAASPAGRSPSSRPRAAQPFQLAAFTRFSGHACVQGKPIRLGDPLPVSVLPARREGLQREGLLALAGAEGDPLGDRVALQCGQRILPAVRLQGQVAAFSIPHQDAPPLQRTFKFSALPKRWIRVTAPQSASSRR